jgi:DNA-binding HxlR family transcriptional regulator
MTPHCDKDKLQAVHAALAVVGDRWSALIIRLLHEGPMRFKDFEAHLEGISPRTLSQRLDKLVEHGIAAKQTCQSSPGFREYVLTDKGRGLGPIIQAMMDWGRIHT